MRASCVLLALGALTACSGNKTSGEVDGEPVSGARGAIFDRVDQLGVDVAVVWISDTPDLCPAFEDVLSARALRCEDTCEELGEAADAWFTGDVFWTLNTTLRVDGDIVGAYAHDDDPVPAEERFTASFARWDAALWGDEEACLDECRELDPLTEAELSPARAGELEVTEASDDVLEGTFSLGFDDEGELSGQFRATRCAMVGWLL